MNAILALFLLFGMLWAFKSLADWTCPLAGRAIGSVARLCTKLLWTQPARHFGAGPTILGFFFLFTVLSTVASLANQTKGAMTTTLFLWSLLYLIWRFLRWRASRQFQPRPLPQRDRGRER